MAQPEVRCVEFVEIVTEWMEGALVDDDRVAVEEHIAICPHCAVYVDQLRAAQAALAGTVLADATPTEAPPPAARNALLEAFRRRNV
jgi:anti-sigma factor RsiW